MDRLMLWTTIFIAFGSSLALSNERYVYTVTGGPAPVYTNPQSIVDASDLIQAGSIAAANSLASCTIPDGSRVRLTTTDSRVVIRVLALDGPSAGCKGYAFRSYILRTDTMTGKSAIIGY